MLKSLIPFVKYSDSFPSIGEKPATIVAQLLLDGVGAGITGDMLAKARKKMPDTLKQPPPDPKTMGLITGGTLGIGGLAILGSNDYAASKNKALNNRKRSWNSKSNKPRTSTQRLDEIYTKFVPRNDRYVKMVNRKYKLDVPTIRNFLKGNWRQGLASGIGAGLIGYGATHAINKTLSTGK